MFKQRNKAEATVFWPPWKRRLPDPARRSLVASAVAEEGTRTSVFLWIQCPVCPMADYSMLSEAAFLPRFWKWLENRHLTPIRGPAARQSCGLSCSSAAISCFAALLSLEMVEPSCVTQIGIWKGLQWILYKLKKWNWSKDLNRKLLKHH